ncbi:MAG: DUF973 family protein [Thermoplasmata archaeon]
MAYPSAPTSTPMYAPTAPPSHSSTDVEGVDHLKIGAILGIVVQAAFWVGFLVFYLIFSALSSTVTSGTPASFPSWITPNTFYLAVALMAGGLVLGILSYIFFFLGFRAVKRGAPDFGAPTTLMVVGLVGYLMAVLGIVVIIGTILSAINSAAAGSVTPGNASLDISALLSGIALIGLGAILGLIGVIGLVLGNWRAGSRYGESTLKVGAILTILPYVSIVGYILLLVGYIKAGTKLRTGGIPSNMGAGASGVPPPPPGA